MKQIRPYIFVAENNVGIAYFEELPRCDFCGKPARFDAMTNLRGHPAAYFCEHCFLIYARMPPPWDTPAYASLSMLLIQLILSFLE